VNIEWPVVNVEVTCRLTVLRMEGKVIVFMKTNENVYEEQSIKG
jgi:hypothetical protein